MTDAEATWRDTIPASDKEAWYSEATPKFGSTEIAPEQIEAARRFVAKWLEEKETTGATPDVERDGSLTRWLNVLLASTGDGDAYEATSRRPVFRVDYRLDTGLRSEGFEKAAAPWLRLYTDNADWVRALPWTEQITIDGEPLPQNFIVAALETGAPAGLDEEQRAWQDEANDEYRYEVEVEQSRFIGYLAGVSNEELDAIVMQRLNQWAGV